MHCNSAGQVPLREIAEPYDRIADIHSVWASLPGFSANAIHGADAYRYLFVLRDVTSQGL
jgi:hypothetical protein